VDNLTATITALLNLQGTLNRSFGDAVPAPFNYRPSTSYTLGTGAKQLSTFYRAARTLAASANEDLDLSGVLADDLGTTIAFTKVKILFIENTSAVDTLSIGGAASNQWLAPFGSATDKFKIPPKSRLPLWSDDATGWAVVAGTGDLLRVANGAGGSTTYNILIAGS
jgi:hypothetical protein